MSPDEILREEFNRWAEAGRGEEMESHHLFITEQTVRHMGLRPGERVLDLGCGTGFLGALLAQLPLAPLVGVDVSGRMLALARRKGVYAELRQADVETVLAEEGEPWPLMVAGDLFCFFGELEGVLRQARARLSSGPAEKAGLLLFSL
jgi:predicted TPR repeat methyltransferase